MADHWRTGWSLVKETWQEWNDDHAPRLAAALAFWTVLSLAPLLVIALRVAATVFGDENARGEIEHQLTLLVGGPGKESIREMLDRARGEESGFVATLLSSLMLVIGASAVFGELQGSLNAIWNVVAKPDRGWWGFARDYLLSVTLVLGTALLMLASLIASAVLTSLGANSLFLGEEWKLLSQAWSSGISLLVFTGLFALMFKLVPDVTVAWYDVWLGAGVTAVLFMLGKSALALYLGLSAVSSPYGVAGSLVVLLLWVYYSAQILFFGAELTQVHARRAGRHVGKTPRAHSP